MQAVNAIALFCEDIREEKNDIVTLVGLLPDTVEIEMVTAAEEAAGTTKIINKLCLFVRINFDPDDDIIISEIRLRLPDNEIIKIGDIQPDLIAKAKTDSKTKGNVLAGIISRAVLVGFKPPDGSLRVEADINGATFLIGALTFKKKTVAN